MASTHEKCGLGLLGQSRAPSFPYFSDWKFDYQSDLKPKVIKLSYSSCYWLMERYVRFKYGQLHDQAKVYELQAMFAGEATYITHYSTIHGAYFHGFKEANRLLKH
ncbi:unnamed protein product [Brassica rapa subsp. trilocularis]